MSKKVSLKIDGKDIHVPEGTNLIEAAKSAGIHIPNLCHLKGMKGIGACRLCLVEIVGLKAPMIACTTKAKDGMVVNTKTDKIEEVRKFVIDLILSMHPLDCMTCTKAGVCNLQQYAYDFELQESNFTRKKFGYPIDEANPFIKRDPDYCILCARCVRVCKEQGTDVLDFMGRGVGAKVVTAMDKPLQESGCTFCGSCVDACPVNALLEADRWRKGREWDYEKTRSVCLSCGNGCEIIASTKDGSVVKINSGASEGNTEKYICAIGRYGFDSVSSDARVTVPMKRTGNSLKETTWDDALQIVAKKLKKSGMNTGFISTAGILNQDASLLSKFASTVVKTKNIDTTVSIYSDNDSMKLSDSADIDSADLIVLIGLDPSQWERVLPALDASIRKRVARGAKLIVINNEETRISSVATLSIKDDEISALKGLAKAMISRGSKAGKELESAVKEAAISEETEKGAELLSAAHSSLILTSPSLFKASGNLSLLKKEVKVIAVPLEANARGVISMGLVTGGKTYKEMAAGGRNDSSPSGVDVLYAVGEVPVVKRPKVDFLVVQSSYMTELAKKADIVFPSAVYLESKGTITDYLGRTRELKRVIEPSGSAMQHKDIFIALSKAMAKPLKESSAAAKKTAKAKAKFSPFKKEKGIKIDTAQFIEAINRSVIKSSRLLWLQETEKAAMV